MIDRESSTGNLGIAENLIALSPRRYGDMLQYRSAKGLALFRFNLPMRWFGRYVQEQVFLFLSWAVPLLVLATAIATLLVAMA